ncbi:MAG TPA: hypothetical protein VGP55_03030 [Chitinophagaceae bacterium]|nr:hypothetical protein [Chitinophagaceae bacterium]
MVYIPYGILCIAITIVIMNGLKKSRDNKKTNRSIRNSERFQNTISIVKSRKEKGEDKSHSTEN